VPPLTSTPEWLPETTIRRRLWSLAKFKRSDFKIGLSVRQLIDYLVTAHIKNWYGDKIQVDSKGVQIFEWTSALEFVSRLQPNIWPGEPVKAPAPDDTTRTQHAGSKRKRGTKPLVRERVEADMRSALDSGQLTDIQLNDMLEKELEHRFGASRGTCRNARLAVLSQKTLTNFDKLRQNSDTPTSKNLTVSRQHKKRRER
jgi:hypothetical protein